VDKENQANETITFLGTGGARLHDNQPNSLPPAASGLISTGHKY